MILEDTSKIQNMGKFINIFIFFLKKKTKNSITHLIGSMNSYEREFYDMIRSAFLKYSFQVRIGHMNGIFVAYHNTEEIFGFEYVSIQEIDQNLFGSHSLGDKVRKLF